jgi:glycerol kinase
MSTQLSRKQFLVLDQGGHASRAFIIDASGRIMASYLTCRLLEEKPSVADPVNASRTLLWSFARCT